MQQNVVNETLVLILPLSAKSLLNLLVFINICLYNLLSHHFEKKKNYSCTTILKQTDYINNIFYIIQKENVNN